jgi:hypothetical protein
MPRRTRRHGDSSTALANARRLALLVALAAIVPACHATGAAPVPSAACGGFHLEVANDGTRAIDVVVGGAPGLRIEPGTTFTFVEYGSPVMPALPWRVEILRAGDRSRIDVVTVAENADGGATLRVSDPAVDGPAAIRGC